MGKVRRLGQIAKTRVKESYDSKGSKKEKAYKVE